MQPGEIFRARGWVLAPQNAGSVSIGLDYLNGVYQNYDLNALRGDMQPYFDWAEQNNVPLFVGEFGAMTSAPGFGLYFGAERDEKLAQILRRKW